MSADMLEKSMRQRCFAGHNARFLTGRPVTLLVATGVVQICEAVVDVDESNAGSAVYSGGAVTNPAAVTFAGGLSPYGTMGQGGNVFEWNESAFDGTNSLSSENRAVRGGAWFSPFNNLRTFGRLSIGPAGESDNIGFRVASVPEPSTYALLLMVGAGWLLWKRRKAALGPLAL
jgi:hypothetical protein